MHNLFWTECFENVIRSEQEDVGSESKTGAEEFFHVSKTRIEHIGDKDGATHQGNTDNDSKKHLILLSLLDTLLPDVILKGGLLRTTCVSECDNVLDKAVINALQIENWLVKETLECLTHAERGGADRVFTFVDEVEDLNDDWMLQQILHVHLVHDVKAVFSLTHVEDWLGHELV